MLDGRAVLIPRGSFTATPNPNPPDDLGLVDGLAAVVFDGGETLELCGQRLPIPPIRCYHPAARLDGVAEALVDARSANPQGLRFTFTATGNDTFLAFMPERYSGDAVTASPWDLTGIPEPDNLPTTDRPGPESGRQD
jgi:hypothetical protein